MISGQVRDEEARVHLRVIGPEGRQREIDAAIDTGYSGMITLPSHIIADLGLIWRSLDNATLGDGSECSFDVFNGRVLWDGSERDVLVDKSDMDPVIGMAMLSGYELKIQIRNRGKVTIKRLPRKTR